MSGKRFFREETGQTVVLVALTFTLLLGFTGLAVDAGRFYAERRFIQNAVDSAALACARNYAQAGTSASAWAAADAILQGRNLLHNPLGISVSYPAQGSEVYQDNVVDERNLISGILPVSANGYGCRVAITVDVPTYMIKVLNPTLTTISATTRAYAKAKGGFLPSVVPRYDNQPGPGNGDPTQFIDHVMQQGFDYQCTSTSTAGCTLASAASPGREFVLLGQSAKATNDNSFRGYIGLDVRDFTTENGAGDLVHDAYNGLTGTESVNTLKDFEATWIDQGYPGPDVCTVTPGSFLPCAQISVINGSSSGIFVDDYNNHFRIGDILLLQLYDGTIKTVPDFTLAPTTLVLQSNQTNNTTVAFTYSNQFRTSGSTVTTTLIPDNGTITDDTGTSPVNPFLTGGCAETTTGTFSANPTPSGGSSSYTQAWNNIVTANCDKGIYTAWLRGTASAPYTSRIHDNVVTINVDGQQRDFSLTTSDSYASVALGTQANYTIRVTTGGGSSRWTASNALTLSWAKCPTTVNLSISPAKTLTCGVDGSIGTTSVSNVDPGEDHVFNVQTTGASALSGESYRGWIRATGTDENNKRVTHLLEIKVDLSVVAGGVTQYVDVIGYAAFKITAISSNDVSGRAVTAAFTDPNDPALAIAKVIRLVPWETP